MAAKKIQVSLDDVTYLTLSGSTGEYRQEAATVNDTVYGQSFQSQDTSLQQFTVTANGIFKGVAGYIARIKKTGVATVMTDEAASLVGGQVYQVTNDAKRVIDYATAVVVKDNGVDHTADVASLDYLSGTITFRVGYTITGPVTICNRIALE